MNYWELGYDSSRHRYGIPAREHPDYKARAKRLAAITAELRKMAEEVIYPRYMEEGQRLAEAGITRPDPAYASAYAELRDWHDAQTKPLRDEQRAIRDTVDGALYRWNGGSLTVRYDRTGKLAWEHEFNRLGFRSDRSPRSVT
jgi:hypothetical protein